jgi:WD40 repeat protein
VAVIDTDSGRVVGNRFPNDACTLWHKEDLRPMATSADGAQLLVRWQRQISREGYGPVPGPSWWTRLTSTEPPFVEPASVADALAVSADGSRVAISAPGINRTLVFDGATGALVREICPFRCHDKYADTRRNIALSSDGAVLLVSSDDTGHAAWDTQTGHFLFALQDPSRKPDAVRDKP